MLRIFNHNRKTAKKNSYPAPTKFHHQKEQATPFALSNTTAKNREAMQAHLGSERERPSVLPEAGRQEDK